MKNFFSSVLIIALLAVSLAYVGCQKDGSVNAPTASTTTTQPTGLHKAASGAPFWAAHIPLKMGNAEVVIGEVIVWNDLTTVYFTGVLDTPYVATDSHLGISTAPITTNPGGLCYNNGGNLEFEVPIASAKMFSGCATAALSFDQTYVFMYHLSVTGNGGGTALACGWAKSGSQFTSSCTFTVRSLYTISGSVTDSVCNGTQSAGQGIANDSITIAGTFGSEVDVTDGNGGYASSLIPAGTWTASSAFTGTSQSVTLGPSATVNFYKDERPNGSCSAVTGTLLQTDCNGTTSVTHGLANQSVSMGGSFSATTDANGNYTFSNVPPGSYSVTWGSVVVGNAVVSSTSGPYSAGSYTNDNRPNSSCAAVTGSLLYKDCDHQSGAPIVGAPVTLGSWTVYTDANGNYTFSNVPEGSYDLSWGATTIAAAVSVPSTDGSYNAGSYVDNRIPPGGCTVDYGCSYSQGYWFGGSWFNSKGTPTHLWPITGIITIRDKSLDQAGWYSLFKGKLSGSVKNSYTQPLAMLLSGSSVHDPAALAALNTALYSTNPADIQAAVTFISNWIAAHDCP
jgi:hypothetical protein